MPVDDLDRESPVPTWAYHPAHGARLFMLVPGAALPAGWCDAPRAGQHPHDVARGIAPPGVHEPVATEAPAPARRRVKRARRRRR